MTNLASLTHPQPVAGAAERRFLVVDDSVTMRRILSNVLKQLGYGESVQAGNGRDALLRLQTEQVDVVITDWQMPEMNGLDLIKALRKSPKTSHLPILVVTGHASVEDVKGAVEFGINAYVLKPFTVETIREKVESLSDYLTVLKPTSRA
jgi:two-component system chemotaxis response regulator CheY